MNAYSGGIGKGLAVLPGAGEHLRWGFLEKFWLQGCKFWGILVCDNGDLVVYYIHRLILDIKSYVQYITV